MSYKLFSKVNGVVLLSILLLPACAGVDYGKLSINPVDKVSTIIPDACLGYYSSFKKTKVSVTQFLDGQKLGGSTPQQYGSSGYNENNYMIDDESRFRKYLANNAGLFLQSIIENKLANENTIQLYSRSQIVNILREQKFQMTVSDPDTVAQFGRLSGVDYLITGYVNSIGYSYYEKPASNFISVNSMNLFSFYHKDPEKHWTVSTDFTIQLIDVSTGKIIKSERFTDSLTKQLNYFNPSFILNMAKESVSNALSSFMSKFGYYFDKPMYIDEMRGKISQVLISKGTNYGINKGDILNMYATEEISDLNTGKALCQLRKIKGYVVVKKTSPTSSIGWLQNVDKNKKSKNRPKIGTILYKKRN